MSGNSSEATQGDLQYFTDGELMILVEHAPDAVSNLIAVLDEALSNLTLDYEIHLNAERRQSFSMNMTKGSPSPRDRTLFMLEIVHEVDFHDLGIGNDQRVVDLYKALTENIGELNEQLGDSANLVGFMPNFTFASSQSHVTSGGPGSHPIQPAPPVNPGVDEQFYMTMTAPIGAIFQCVENTTPVEVIILDTSPSIADFDRALNDYLQINPLLNSLCKGSRPCFHTETPLSAPDSPLHVYYPAQAKITALMHAEYHSEDYLYNISDHGVFVAGIIHNIARHARLHLVQVLNDYGVGTLETMAMGLNHLLNAGNSNPHFNRDNRIIVNCSLVMGLSTDSQDSPTHVKVKTENNNAYVQVDDVFQNWIALLDWYLDTLQLDSIDEGKVLAAAGNNGTRPDGTRRGALYPAAFSPVVGVGSKEAYSNEADRPEEDGAIVFGGRLNPAGLTTAPLADKAQGVLSLYFQKTIAVNSFNKPDQTVSNTDGWARWTGTSFSTAILSGIIAAMCERGITPRQAWLELQKMFSGTPGHAAEIHVKQG